MEKSRVTLFEGYNKEIIQGLRIFPGSKKPALPLLRALVKTSLGNIGPCFKQYLDLA